MPENKHSSQKVPQREAEKETRNTMQHSIVESKQEDTFQATTLEDLEPQPMPLVQKIVLAVATVLVIVAVLYIIFTR